MKNLLENLGDLGTAKVTSEIVDNYNNIRVSLRYKMKKGNFVQEISGYGDIGIVHEKYYHISMEDWDINSTQLGSLNIDNVENLKETLKNSGLTSIADCLEFSNEEIEKEFIKTTLKCQEILTMYEEGKGLVNYNLLSNSKKAIVKLESLLKVEDCKLIKGRIYTSDEALSEEFKKLKELEEIKKKDIKAAIKRLKSKK